MHTFKHITVWGPKTTYRGVSPLRKEYIKENIKLINDMLETSIKLQTNIPKVEIEYLNESTKEVLNSINAIKDIEKSIKDIENIDTSDYHKIYVKNMMKDILNRQLTKEQNNLRDSYKTTEHVPDDILDRHSSLEDQQDLEAFGIKTTDDLVNVINLLNKNTDQEVCMTADNILNIVSNLETNQSSTNILHPKQFMKPVKLEEQNISLIDDVIKDIEIVSKNINYIYGLGNIGQSIYNQDTFNESTICIDIHSETKKLKNNTIYPHFSDKHFINVLSSFIENNSLKETIIDINNFICIDTNAIYDLSKEQYKCDSDRIELLVLDIFNRLFDMTKFDGYDSGPNIMMNKIKSKYSGSNLQSNIHTITQSMVKVNWNFFIESTVEPGFCDKLQLSIDKLIQDNFKILNSKKLPNTPTIIDVHCGLSSMVSNVNIYASPERYLEDTRYPNNENNDINKLLGRPNINTNKFIQTKNLYYSHKYLIKKGVEIYKHLMHKYNIIHCTNKEAEISKLIENTQRYQILTANNTLAKYLKETYPDDYKDILELCQTKKSFIPIELGLIGGGCIPVDPLFLKDKDGKTPEFIKDLKEVNDRQLCITYSKIMNQIMNQIMNIIYGFINSNKHYMILDLDFIPEYLEYKENSNSEKNSKYKELYDNIIKEFTITKFIQSTYIQFLIGYFKIINLDYIVDKSNTIKSLYIVKQTNKKEKELIKHLDDKKPKTSIYFKNGFNRHNYDEIDRFQLKFYIVGHTTNREFNLTNKEKYNSKNRIQQIDKIIHIKDYI